MDFKEFGASVARLISPIISWQWGSLLQKTWKENQDRQFTLSNTASDPENQLDQRSLFGIVPPLQLVLAGMVAYYRSVEAYLE